MDTNEAYRTAALCGAQLYRALQDIVNEHSAAPMTPAQLQVVMLFSVHMRAYESAMIEVYHKGMEEGLL